MVSGGNRSRWRCSSGHKLYPALATPFTMTTAHYTSLPSSLVHLTTYCIYTTPRPRPPEASPHCIIYRHSCSIRSSRTFPLTLLPALHSIASFGTIALGRWTEPGPDNSNTVVSAVLRNCLHSYTPHNRLFCPQLLRLCCEACKRWFLPVVFSRPRCAGVAEI